MHRGERFGFWRQAPRAVGLILIVLPFATRAAQCPQDPPSVWPRLSQGRAAGSPAISASINAAAAACRHQAVAESAASRARALSSRQQPDLGHNLDYQSLRDSESSRVADAAAEDHAAIESRFGVRWRTVVGPEWVRNVPQWAIDDARNYKRRGLPLVHLWQSTQYQIAFGLSSRGVPGVYFSQKIP